MYTETFLLHLIVLRKNVKKRRETNWKTQTK